MTRDGKPVERARFRRGGGALSNRGGWRCCSCLKAASGGGALVGLGLSFEGGLQVRHVRALLTLHHHEEHREDDPEQPLRASVKP